MKNAYWFLVAAYGLGACGGGGGSIRGDPFVSFSAITPNQTVEASAVSLTATATVDSTDTVLSRTINAADSENSRVRLSYNALLDLTDVAIFTPQSNVAWTGFPQVMCDPVVCLMEDPSSVGTAINPIGADWDYQTFGMWAVDTSATTGIIGVISLGNPTPANAIPAGGSATYSGTAGGIHIDESGMAFGYVADVSATANFGAASVAFATSNSESLDTVSTPLPALDMTGTLTIQPGTSTFSGPVTNTYGTSGMSGTATGRFYGPLYEEIGGVFGLTGDGPSTLLGAFGGKR